MVQIVSPWIGSGTSQEDARRPKVSDDYSILSRTQLADDYQGDASKRVDEVVCSGEVLEQIRANPEYIVL